MVSDPQPPIPGEHDLPPRWNGRVVEWEGWKMPAPVFVCPPPRAECCPNCGSLTEQPVNCGVVVAVIELFAHRCPDCRHDTVMELSTGDWWDLDLSDYEDGGSDHPAGIVRRYLR
jgi:hypothetical protein